MRSLSSLSSAASAGRVSLSFELEMLGQVLEGIRLLSEGLGEDRYATEAAGRQACMAAAASLSLVSCRVSLLVETFRGRCDPRQLWAPHNAVPMRAPSPEGEDLRLRFWSDSRRIAACRSAMERAEARMAQSTKSSLSKSRRSEVRQGRKSTGSG